jgi:hypothetical protein
VKKSKQGRENGKLGGRPPHRDGPRVPYDVVDRILVQGEVVQLEDGTQTVTYPTYRELADRYGVAMSNIAEHARRHNVLQRRKALQDRVESRTEEKLVELRAKAAAMTKDDVVRIVESYILKFAKAIEEDKVRLDTIADLNVAIRAREFLMGNAESRSEVHSLVLKLDELQERHREAVRRVEVTSAAERGEVPRRLPDKGDGILDDIDSIGTVVVDAQFEEQDAGAVDRVTNPPTGFSADQAG